MQFRISNPQKEILKELLIVGGVITVALVAPNAIQLLNPLLNKKHNRHESRLTNHSASRMLASLESKGYVQIEAQTITLTTKGMGYTQILVDVDNYQPKLPWDNKWRMVCFDVPEVNKSARNFLRDNLDKIGFVHLQKSVYIYPYDCLAVVNQIVEHFGIARYVTFGVLDMIENDTSLRNNFNLG